MLGNRHLRRIVGDYERSAQLWFRYHFPFETDAREDVEAIKCCADLLLASWRRHRCLFKITIATLSDILLLSGRATYCMHMRGHLNVRTCTTQYILLHRKPRNYRNRTQYFLTNSKKKKTRQKADCTDSAGAGYCVHKGMRDHLNAHIYTIQ